MNSLNRKPSKVPGYNTELNPVAYTAEAEPLDRVLYAHAADWANSLLAPVAKITTQTLLLILGATAFLIFAIKLIAIGYPSTFNQLIFIGRVALPATCFLSLLFLILSAGYQASKKQNLLRFTGYSLFASLIFTGLVLLFKTI